MNNSNLAQMWILREQRLGFFLAVFSPMTALCFFVSSQVFQNTLVGANWFGVAIFLVPLLLPLVLFLCKTESSFVEATAILIPLEVLAVFLAQYTLIGVSSLLIVLLVWANVIPIVLFLTKQKAIQLGAWILLALLALVILVPQARLGVRLLMLESEAKRIIAYAYDQKLRTGSFPVDLSSYSFRYSKLQAHFAYHGHGTDDKFTYPFEDGPHYDQSDKFSLRYYVGSRNTAYWFSSKKGWFVEDD